MRIRVVTVGRLKERFYRDACDEYLKRLGRYAALSVVEVADRDHESLGDSRALAEEGIDILKRIPERDRVILLDREGVPTSSERLAERLAEWGVSGESDVTFVLGGSVGVSPEVVARADERISFGPLTLPHNLARVVLLEQLYRAFRINRGEPYHK